MINSISFMLTFAAFKTVYYTILLTIADFKITAITNQRSRVPIQHVRFERFMCIMASLSESYST
jgi:hypothetical protein